MVLLRRYFIPCMISALNTKELMHDPRDAATLGRYVSRDLDDFDGGEREAFLLPSGEMLGVFLSLRSSVEGSPFSHYTRAGRQSDDVVRTFRKHARQALRRLRSRLPARWVAVWAGTDPEVAQVRATEPRWPRPASGEALRVFVRNSYLMYDELTGCKLVAVSPAQQRAWLSGATVRGARLALPEPLFHALLQAMHPRGMIGPRPAADSLRGNLVLVVEQVEAERITGRVTGTFAIQPEDLAEVGRRRNAACRFRLAGELSGRFEIDRRSGRLTTLQAAGTGIDFAMLPRSGMQPYYFAPSYRVAIEWARAAQQPHRRKHY
ncbi:MAG: hypothetical protein KDC87_01165 [Planctomycetes bacterium]|nr:hypothetical protein [Planctomycetota bacterium]